MQLSIAKFQKSFILNTKKWIKCFPEKNPVNSRGKSGDITRPPPSPPAGLARNRRREMCKQTPRPAALSALPSSAPSRLGPISAASWCALSSLLFHNHYALVTVLLLEDIHNEIPSSHVPGLRTHSFRIYPCTKWTSTHL